MESALPHRHISLEEISALFDSAEAYETYICSSAHRTLFLTGSAEIDEDLKAESLATDIEEMLNMLTDKEKDILKRAYGIGVKEHSLEEIGLIYQLSRERVRQIKEKAIRRLKCRAPRALITYLA